jgi:hypothetical protein
MPTFFQLDRTAALQLQLQHAPMAKHHWEHALHKIPALKPMQYAQTVNVVHLPQLIPAPAAVSPF